MKTKKVSYPEITNEEFIYYSKVMASRIFAKHLDDNYNPKKQKSNPKTYTF